jgi:hypothetical protein
LRKENINIMKTIILSIALLFFASGIYSQQTPNTPTKDGSKRKQYPHFSITPNGGAIFPLPKVLSSSFKPGGMFGLDLSYRLNKEVALYINGSYAFMSSKTTGAPIGSYIIGSLGPRYYFTHKNLKSALFLEAGVGVYNFRQNSYSVQDTSGTTLTIDQISDSKAGLSGGIGGSLALSKEIDILVKTDYHVVFTPNGSSSFMSVMGGLEFRFR